MRINQLVFLTLLLLWSGRIGAQTPISSSPATEATLTAGDIVKIAVWREPDLSGEFVVNENGIVILPLLGKVNVLEIPISQLRDRLIERYAVELTNPSITVTPLRRIYVLGEVARPGVFTVDPTLSLAGVVALAGGATATGDLNHLRVVRNGVVVIDNASSAQSLTAVNLRSDDQVFVDRRSWLDRNSGFVASALVSVSTLAITLLVR
jgi:protein involved in polysaccharide export with SLBB domain